MQANTTKSPAAIRVDLAAIFVSLELSRSKWLVTSLSPGGGERMSRHLVSGGDIPGLLDHFAELQRKAEVRTGQSFRIISIQEAGLDGFWIHRVLEREGIESYVVDPASIATSRRRRRAKTDRIDEKSLAVARSCIYSDTNIVSENGFSEHSIFDCRPRAGGHRTSRRSFRVGSSRAQRKCEPGFR